jgi:hypothetical protein
MPSFEYKEPHTQTFVVHKSLKQGSWFTSSDGVGVMGIGMRVIGLGPLKLFVLKKRATPKEIKVLVLLFGLFTVPLSTALHQSNFVWSHMKFKI